jgi:DNA-binding response OmpR family regulator
MSVHNEPVLERMLIVEGNPALAAPFASLLAKRARLVRSAPSAELASSLLADLQPDLVLLDVAVPSAFALLERMQSLELPPVVVALSNTGAPEERFRLGHLGVRTCLDRPFTGDALEAALDWALLRPSNFRS